MHSNDGDFTRLKGAQRNEWALSPETTGLGRSAEVFNEDAVEESHVMLSQRVFTLKAGVL